MSYPDIKISYPGISLPYHTILVQYLDHKMTYRDMLKRHNQAKIVFSLLYMSIICEH